MEQFLVQLFSLGTVSAMVTSPSSLYLAITTQKNINIYLVTTGHALPVTDLLLGRGAAKTSGLVSASWMRQ